MQRVYHADSCGTGAGGASVAGGRREQGRDGVCAWVRTRSYSYQANFVLIKHDRSSRSWWLDIFRWMTHVLPLPTPSLPCFLWLYFCFLCVCRYKLLTVRQLGNRLPHLRCVYLPQPIQSYIIHHPGR